MATIETEDALAKLLDASSAKPLIIFKHSNACPISARAFGEVERFMDSQDQPGFDFGMIIVQKQRDVSDAIESRLGIRHETPQLIVVRNGQAIWHASHYDVTGERISGALEGA